MPNPEPQYVPGGTTRVELLGEVVRRDANEWTPSVHRYLRHLRANSFDAAPLPVRVEDGGSKEVLEYIAGDVGNYPLSDNVRSTEALVSSATLLRQLHDAGAGFVPTHDDVWMLPARRPAETICHGDFAPYNIVYEGTSAIGVIDFDGAHPAPRVWDIAYALYRFAPLTAPENTDGFGDLATQCQRARLFYDAYGLDCDQRTHLPELVIERLQALIAYMTVQAQRGHPGFAANIEAGHHTLYHADCAWIATHAYDLRAQLHCSA